MLQDFTPQEDKFVARGRQQNRKPVEIKSAGLTVALNLSKDGDRECRLPHGSTTVLGWRSMAIVYHELLSGAMILLSLSFINLSLVGYGPMA